MGDSAKLARNVAGGSYTKFGATNAASANQPYQANLRSEQFGDADRLTVIQDHPGRPETASVTHFSTPAGAEAAAMR